MTRDLVTLGVTAAEIAWPIVLAVCIGLMIFPFAFLYLAKRGGPAPREEEAAPSERVTSGRQ